MAALEAIGGETWFRLGDRDLAMHVERTRALRGGMSLTEFTSKTARRLGIAATILPMSDDPVATIVMTAEGALPFQRYFVGLQCAPVLKGLEFFGADRAAASDRVMAALRNPDLAAVIVCPSNPYLSVDPILAIADIRAALDAVTAPIIAVSPLIGGKAVKGPTAKIMAELGVSAEFGEHCAALRFPRWLDHRRSRSRGGRPDRYRRRGDRDMDAESRGSR